MPEDRERKTIFRVADRSRWLHMEVTPLHRNDLSLKEKGLLCVMLSFPDNWEFHFGHIVSLSTDGPDATRNAMRRLIENNYVVMTEHRNSWKFDQVTYEVYERPYKENPHTDKPYTENPTLTNDDFLSSDKNTKKTSGKAAKTKTGKPKEEKEGKNDPWAWEDEDSPIREFGLAFEKLIGRRPLTRGEMALWISGRPTTGAFGFRHFLKIGATVDDMITAYEAVKKMRSPKISIKNPNSIWFYIDEMKREKKDNSVENYERQLQGMRE